MIFDGEKIRVRDKGYYNIDKSDYCEIQNYCRSSDFDDFSLLKESAEEVNASISKYIIESILRKISYEKLTTRYTIPVQENDFYLYRKLTIILFYKRKKEQEEHEL